MAVSRDDLLELVIRLENRAHTLRIIADFEAANGDRPMGFALATLSADMTQDLHVLSDGIGFFEGAA